MKTTLRVILTIGVFLIVALPCPAQEWTRFRGPNGTGLSDATIPDVWTEQEFNWKRELPGIGHSSPVVWGERLFVTSADPTNATQFVIAVDTTDGKILWQLAFPISSYPIHVRNSFASASPAVDADHVYVAWATPNETTVTALDHQGHIVWQKPQGPFVSDHGWGISPILYGNSVILSILEMKPEQNGPRTLTSRVIALDRKTGESLWSTPRLSDVVSYSVPCIYQPAGAAAQLICCCTAHGIFSLNPDTGAENWSLEVFDKRTVSSPLVADGLIFGSTGSGAGGNYVVALNPAPTPHVAYEMRKQAPYVPTVVAKNGLAFLWYDKGIVTCMRTSDGQQIWQERVGGNYSGSPVIAGDRLYCVDDDGVVVVLSATDKFAELAKNPLGEACRSTPAIDGGRMYIHTYSHLVSVGGKQAK